MQDAISLKTGNSRYLKSVSGFMSLYPTYEDFVAALVAGTLPIDLNGINPDGWAQLGMELDKAHLLTDSTAAMLNLGSEASVNDALATLAQKADATEQLITYGTTDLAAGAALTTGTIYVKYQ